MTQLTLTSLPNIPLVMRGDDLAMIILRGLRDGGDFNYENQMSSMNAQLAPDIETVFVAASPGTAHITGTLVRQIASLGGDVSSFVSPTVLYRIGEKFKVSMPAAAFPPR